MSGKPKWWYRWGSWNQNGTRGFDGAESKLMQMVLVIFTQIVRWDGVGFACRLQVPMLVYLHAASAKSKAPVWEAATRAKGGLPPLCHSWENLPTQGVLKELFLGIRTIPHVRLPKGLFCLQSQPQHQVSMLWLQIKVARSQWKRYKASPRTGPYDLFRWVNHNLTWVESKLIQFQLLLVFFTDH